MIKILSVTMWPLFSTGFELCSYLDNWAVVLMIYVLYILIKCVKGFEICGVSHVAFIQQIYRWPG